MLSLCIVEARSASGDQDGALRSDTGRAAMAIGDVTLLTPLALEGAKKDKDKEKAMMPARVTLPRLRQLLTHLQVAR